MPVYCPWAFIEFLLIVFSHSYRGQEGSAQEKRDETHGFGKLVHELSTWNRQRQEHHEAVSPGMLLQGLHVALDDKAQPCSGPSVCMAQQSQLLTCCS